MRAHGFLAFAATAVLVAGLGIAGATPAVAASADPASQTVNCDSNTNGAVDMTVTGAVGDTFAVSSSSGSCWIAPTSGSYGGYSFSSGYDGIVTVTGTDPVAGAQIFDENSTGSFTIVGAGSFAIGHGPLIGFRSTLTVVVTEPAPAAGEAPAIPEWVQAYGRDKDARCVDGWDASWESWAEPVTGGWVCTRSIPSLG